MSEPKSQLQFFRILTALGGLLILSMGILNEVTVPDFIDPIWQRAFVGGTLLLYTALTYVNATVRRLARPLFYGIVYLISIWYMHLTYLNALSFNNAFGTVMVIFGCSLGFQSVRSLGVYLASMVAGVAFTAMVVAEPQVDPSFYVRTIAVIGLLSFLTLRSRLRVQVDMVQSEAAMRAVFDESADGLLLLDTRRMRVERCNERVLRLFGVPDGHTLRPLLMQALTPSDDETQLFTSDEYEVRFRTFQGQSFWGSLAVRPMTVRGQQYALIRIADISERKRIEQLKDEFISVVNHELRTPMTSILGSLGLLLGGIGGTLPGQSQKMIQVAHRNCERLLRLINDMLDVQKIASGNVTLGCRTQSLSALIEQAMDAAEGFVAIHGARFEFVPPPTDIQVHVDADRISQVLINLLSNAAKFSPKAGIVTIGILREDKRVRVSVTDRGPGIPEAFRPHLFDKFSQADGSSSRQGEGTGLGLNIAKSLVELHGGEIGFQTVTGQGTTFYFYLPDHTPAPAKHPTLSPLRLKRMFGTT